MNKYAQYTHTYLTNGLVVVVIYLGYGQIGWSKASRVVTLVADNSGDSGYEEFICIKLHICTWGEAGPGHVKGFA